MAPAESRSNALMQAPREHFAPKIYYFLPLLAGPLSSWPLHLQRIRKMGFDTVLSAPVFAPGENNDLFLTADHEHAHSAIGSTLNTDDTVREFAEACKQHDLRLFVDVVLGRVAIDAKLATSVPKWFHAIRPSDQRIDPRIEREQVDRQHVAVVEREDEVGREVMRTEDAREGPRAFIEKRKPVYQGR